MAYVHRVVKAGTTVEHKKMHSSRYQAENTPRKRSANKGNTSEKQALVNERHTEEKLRWIINANYKWKDLHAVLHYYAKDTTFEQFMEDCKLFLKRLRRICARKGITYKVVVVHETKRMTNPHHHIIISRMDPEIIMEAWEGVPAGGGGVSFKPLDNRGNHYKLASYLMKESRSTMERYREMGRRGKRYSCSQNMIKPVITYEVIHVGTWRKDPKPRKGAVLYKFDDGSTCRNGWNEISGYPWQEYFEVFNE